jgi:hypothetical protein
VGVNVRVGVKVMVAVNRLGVEDRPLVKVGMIKKVAVAGAVPV